MQPRVTGLQGGGAGRWALTFICVCLFVFYLLVCLFVCLLFCLFLFFIVVCSFGWLCVFVCLVKFLCNISRNFVEKSPSSSEFIFTKSVLVLLHLSPILATNPLTSHIKYNVSWFGRNLSQYHLYWQHQKMTILTEENIKKTTWNNTKLSRIHWLVHWISNRCD